MRLFFDLSHRRREAEWMDAPGVDAAALGRSLAFIRWINGALGYRRQTIRHLNRFARDWPAGRTITILDVATGSGDMLRAIGTWARRKGRNVRVVGLDLHDRTLAIARQRAPEAELVRGDALRLPFADGEFDYAITSMFLHHLDDDAAVAALREMDRVSRRGVIAADIVRSRRAYAWIWILTAPTGEMIRHDARVSVKQAFSVGEAESLRQRAGLEYARVFRHFGHRFVLAGEKMR